MSWRERVTTARQAISAVAPGDRVFIHTGAANPVELVAEMVRQAGRLYDVEIYFLSTAGPAPYLADEVAEHFRVRAFFVSDSIRDAVADRRVEYVPVHLSAIGALFEEGRIPIDVALIQLSPPDERGFASLGVSVDVTRAVLDNARLLIAELNPRMPRTFGESALDIDEVDLLVEVDHELVEVPPPQIDPATEQVAHYVSRLVEDGATLEIGIGRAPQAVLPLLGKRKDLGIHTEMFTDPLMELVRSGAVSGRRKSLNAGKIVASFCQGTRALYDFIDGNEAFEFRASSYVNDPAVIRRHDRMVAINTALQVDLTGQVCADSLSHTEFRGGFGGQMDFVRGASLAREGKVIIALPSTATLPDDQGEISRLVSRIVPTLAPGSGVVTSRADVRYVVTEHGIAYLHGKSIHERALALIEIADPRFRTELLEAARELKLVRGAIGELEWKEGVYPAELECRATMNDGTEMLIRPVRPSDEEAVRDIFYSLSERARYFRFFSVLKSLPLARRQQMVTVDYKSELALAAVVEDMGTARVIGVGHYFVDPGKASAEVAFMVHDDWQARGVSRRLLTRLVEIARRAGIERVTATVLAGNAAMLAVFRHAGYELTSTLDGDTWEISFPIPEE